MCGSVLLSAAVAAAMCGEIPKVDLGNLVFALFTYALSACQRGASAALERELPKVDFGNATLSFQKWTLGKRASKSGPWECNFVSSYSLSAGRFQNTNFDNGRVATRT